MRCGHNLRAMRFRNYRARCSPVARAFSIALIAIALVGAQIAGLVHRIEHAPGWDASRTQRHAWVQYERGVDIRVYYAQQPDDGRTPRHDCAAYDAGTLGNGPPVAHFEPVAALPPQPILTAGASTVADNSPHLPFHSRAPPRA